MNETEICSAIRQMRTIGFVYKNAMRRVEPHALGYNRAGKLTLCAFQLSGGSGQDWRDYHVSGMSTLVIYDETFSGPRPGYKPGDKTLVNILCQL